MSKLTIAIFVVVLSAFAVAALLARRSVNRSIQIINIAVDVEGVQRTAIVCIPKAKSNTTLPLVLVFHGMGESSTAMMDASGLTQLAAEKKAIVVFLQTQRNSWRIGVRVEDFADNPDVRYVEAVLASIAAKSSYDPAKVFAMGMSNGASFVESLLFAMPGRFAAVACIAGGLSEIENVPTTTYPTPILLLVGDRDQTGAKEQVQLTALQLEKAGYLVTLRILPEMGHSWDPLENNSIWTFLSPNSVHRVRGGRSKSSDD